MYRPIVVNNLGTWHADIGYFAKNKRYRMPETYQSGYLVAKDVLSRRIYATPLMGSKEAKEVIKAFKRLFEEHKKHLPDVPVVHISFDKERSVIGKEVQQFFSKSGIGFHAFDYSSSKAKHAESAIRQIRSATDKLMKRNRPEDTWYTLLPVVVEALNNQTVRVSEKKLKYSPGEIDSKNVGDFKRRLFKSTPAYYWAQFDMCPDLFRFRYAKGDTVRAKLLATSSAAIGEKRSEKNLTDDLFVILELVPYVTRNMNVGRAYKCRNLRTGKAEVFQEDEITAGRAVDEREPTINHYDPTQYKRVTRAVSRNQSSGRGQA